MFVNVRSNGYRNNVVLQGVGEGGLWAHKRN